MLKTTLAAGLLALAAPAPAGAGSVDVDVRIGIGGVDGIGAPAYHGYNPCCDDRHLLTPQQARIRAPVYSATARKGRFDRIRVWIDARSGRIADWESVRTWRG